MQRILAWFYGWYATLRIMLFERETYGFLRSAKIEDNGPVNVSESGDQCNSRNT